MKATQKLHEMGQSIWLDNITRGLLRSGTLDGYIKELSVTGLTSNPTIFDHAIKNSHDYDDAIHQALQKAEPVEELFFELAIEDLRQAADLFLPIHTLTNLSLIHIFCSRRCPNLLRRNIVQQHLRRLCTSSATLA